MLQLDGDNTFRKLIFGFRLTLVVNVEILWFSKFYRYIYSKTRYDVDILTCLPLFIISEKLIVLTYSDISGPIDCCRKYQNRKGIVGKVKQRSEKTL